MAAARGLREALNPRSWRKPKGQRSYEEHQTDAEFVTAAEFKGASLEPADTVILHPTAGDAITAFVCPRQPAEKLLRRHQSRAMISSSLKNNNNKKKIIRRQPDILEDATEL